MKKLLLTLITLFSPVALLAQMNNVSFNLYPSESFGFGVGGTCAPNDIGVGIFIASDLRGKHNSSELETGIGANIAVELRQSDQVDSWITVTGVVTRKISNTFWFLGGAGVSLYDTVTEHSDRYWVYRGRESATNLLVGTMISESNSISFNAIFNTEPIAVGLGMGIKIDSNVSD